MSVCGPVAFCDSHGPRQWRGGGRGATAAPGFSQGFCGVYGILCIRACRNAWSALQERLDLLVEFLERGLALDLLAIDERGRRRIDLQHLTGEFLIGGDLVEQRLVLEAALDGLLAETGLLADPGQRFRGVLPHPVV